MFTAKGSIADKVLGSIRQQLLPWQHFYSFGVLKILISLQLKSMHGFSAKALSNLTHWLGFLPAVAGYFWSCHAFVCKIATGRNLRQWVRLESAFVENSCVGLSNGEFKIFKTPKP